MTNQPILCPKCDHQLTLNGQFWFCPKHGQVTLEKPTTPLRIFISFGHDSNEELACLIRSDLKKRGHDVWIDKCKIKGGDDWRRKITDGIIDSHRVLSLLSKHSTRDPGVCLDEIAIAIGTKGGNIQTILVESENEVKPPASISHIQWLDMHDWKEQRDSGKVAWEKWYRGKLENIVDVVESDESLRFAGEIKTLEEYLKPVSSDSRVAHLLKKAFEGRIWLVKAIERWRNAEDQTSRLFWIMGAPGVGKSAFAAHLAHYGRDKVIAVQFCEYDKPDHRNALRIVRTLAFQIATRLPDYRRFLLTLPEITELDKKNPSELFDYLLVSPLHHTIDGGRERYLIVIDAIDEAGENGCNELVEMLARNAQRLPDWIGIIITSRPEFDVITPLQGLNPFSLDTKTEDNRADIRDYLHRELALHLQNRPDADLLLEQILEKSEGVFLYVERFCDDVRHDVLSLNHPERFPHGLSGIFFQYFQRQFPNMEKFRKDVRPALRAILAAREPLPIENLQHIFNWQKEELRDFTSLIGSLFTVTIEAGHEVIKPYHKSLTEWLTNEANAGSYFVSVQEGHQMLANTGWLEYKKNGPKNMSHYSFYYLPYHLLETKRYEDLISLLKDKDYVISSWESDEFRVKSWWAAIESSSDLRTVEVYKDVIYYPIKYSKSYLSYIAKLLADTGYIQKSESIHSYLKFYFQLMSDKKNLQVAIGNLGYISLLKGKFNDALRLFEKQEKICRNLSDIEGLIAVLGNKGTALYKIDMLDEAFASFKEQEELCVQMRDVVHLQMCIGNQGNVFFDNQQFDEAMKSYKKQQALCEESGNLQGMCQSIGNQGNVLFKLAMYDEALEHYKKCEQLCKKILYKEGLQRALGDQGKVFLQKIKYDKAHDLFNQQEKICREIKNNRSLGECLRAKAQLFEEHWQFQEAMKLYSELKTIYQSFEDFYGLCDTIECIGFVYLKNEQLDLAFDSFKEMETLSKNKKNRKKNADAIINQGLIFEARGEFDKALNNYQIAEEISSVIKNKTGIPFRYGLQYALNNKADIFLRKGDFEKSLKIYQIQAEICRDTHNYYSLQYSLCSQGTINSDRGDYQKAIQLFLEHSGICKKIYRIFEWKRSLGLTGLTYFKIGDIELAKDTLLEQYRLSKDGKYFHEGVNSLLHLIFILELAGDENAARQYRQKAIETVKQQEPFVFFANLLWNQSIINDIDGNLDYILDFSQNLQEISELFCLSEKDIDVPNFSVTNQNLLGELIHWYQKCENDCIKMGYLMGLQHVLGVQGILYCLKKDYTTATPLFAEQYAICKKMGYCKGEAVSLGRLAKSYLAKGDLDKSERYGKEQYALCIKIGFYEGIIDSKSLLGKIHTRKKEYLEALSDFNDCEKILRENNNFLMFYQVMLYKGAIFFTDKKYEESLHCIDSLQEYLQNKPCLKALNFLKISHKAIYSETKK